MQVRGLSCSIACVTDLADDGLFCDDGTHMGVNLIHVGVIVEAHLGTEHQDDVATSSSGVHGGHYNPTNGRMDCCSFWCEDVNTAMVVVAPRMPERLRIITRLSTSLHRVLNIGGQQHVQSNKNNNPPNDSFHPFSTILSHNNAKIPFCFLKPSTFPDECMSCLFICMSKTTLQKQGSIFFVAYERLVWLE